MKPHRCCQCLTWKLHGDCSACKVRMFVTIIILKMWSPFLSKKHFPAKTLPKTLFEYFVETKYYYQDRKYPCLIGREDFLNTLKTNDEFSKFWAHIKDQHPTMKDYFLSLVSKEKPYMSGWIEYQYEVYQKGKAFDSLLKEERRLLQSEFEQLRSAAYQAALKGESTRLNCEISNVRPSCPLFPYKPHHEEESMLARLPNEIFGRVFPKLDTLDIFRMTLVCRSWKFMVHSNGRLLNKAEHSIPTHLITFTKWMDPASTPSSFRYMYLDYCLLETPHTHSFLSQYRAFSWCLTRWYCRISQSLEALILDHPISYIDLASLLQSCPSLKHLRIGYDLDNSMSKVLASPLRIQLQQLDVFMSIDFAHLPGSSKACLQLHIDILVSSQSLRVFKTALDSHHLLAIVARYSLSNIFSKLIALELEKCTPSVLEMLAQIDSMQLKYLSFGSHDEYSGTDHEVDEVRSINALNQLLPKLSKLEMLKTSRFIGVKSKTIQLMTELKLNINWAVLYPWQCLCYDEEGETRLFNTDEWQPKVLDDFRNMLLSRNPDIDLSKIQFVLRTRETVETLKAMSTGFTIMNIDESDCSSILVEELYDLKIRRQLGIEY